MLAVLWRILLRKTFRSIIELVLLIYGPGGCSLAMYYVQFICCFWSETIARFAVRFRHREQNVNRMNHAALYRKPYTAWSWPCCCGYFNNNSQTCDIMVTFEGGCCMLAWGGMHIEILMNRSLKAYLNGLMV